MSFPLSPGVNTSEIDLITGVQGVSSSIGGLAGVFRWGPVNERVSITNEPSLVSRFGKPTSFNAETFFTAANFLAYGSDMYVVRTANTTSTTSTIGALNAVANTGSVTVANNTVKNSTDYINNKDGTFDANALYVAKYPGALGNSLRVSICDSVNAYSSNLTLLGILSSNTITGSFLVSIGANTGTFSFLSSSDINQANAFSANVAASISNGDLIRVGNSSIGVQNLKVTNVVQSTNASVSSIVLSFDNTYRLSQDFSANTIVNGNSTVVSVTRNWEFSALTGTVPAVSYWGTNFGNNVAIDTMHVVVVDQDGLFSGVQGTILDTFTGLSRSTDAKTADGASNYYKTVINQNSNYIWFTNDRPGAYSNVAVSVVNSINQTPLRIDLAGGTDGYSESAVPLSVVSLGFDMFNTIDVDVSLVMQGKPIGGTTVVNNFTVNNFQLTNYLIDNIAETNQTNKTRVVFVTPDDAIVKANAGSEDTAIVNWYGAAHQSNHTFADHGYKYMYDRYNDVYRYVPLNGDMAGLAASTDASRDSWWSFAGLNRGLIKNIVKLRYNPSTKAARDNLYKNAINPTLTVPGTGTYLDGDKTFTTAPSIFNQIGIRRLFITLEKAISNLAKYSLFEFNDPFTRSQFKSLIIPYLRDIQSRRGITDFIVICDETNNTPNVINNSQFVGDIYIKPNRSINFINLNFVGVRNGVDFTTIIGQF